MPRKISPLLLMLSLLAIGCAHKNATKPSEDMSSQQCFHWAAQNEVAALQSHWLDCKTSNSIQATTLMMVAATHDSIEVLEFLLSQKMDVNERDLSGDTALHYAAATDKTKAVRWLLERGAVNQSYRKDGITPLMISFSRGKNETIEAFLAYPFPIDAPTEEGWTVLFFAIRREDPGLLQKVLALGANPLVRSHENDLPLDIATEQNWLEGMKLLTEATKKWRKSHGKK